MTSSDPVGTLQDAIADLGDTCVLAFEACGPDGGEEAVGKEILAKIASIRSLIDALPGINLTKEEQLAEIASLTEQDARLDTELGLALEQARLGVERIRALRAQAAAPLLAPSQ